MKGKVIKGVGGTFAVAAGEQVVLCKSRKKTRYAGEEIVIGDDVEYEEYEGGLGAITKVLDRKNSLVRPRIANVDALLILISVIPEPDLVLVDKLLVNCVKEGIKALIVVSKADIVDDGFIERIKATYYFMSENIYMVSALTKEGLAKVRQAIDGMTCGLAGQSAVGKTSLLNSLTEGLNLEVGEISLKSNRGKHTTRHNEIFKIGEHTYVTDTAGFSLFTQLDVKYSELWLYYPDFVCEVDKSKCRYSMCAHITEPDCSVKQAVSQGRIDKQRYERYVDIYKELKENYDNEY
ncbi:MAG: ribosome small subunit-dependent GTPase A [Clostridia bacterium]|nr:ribosome small subunit-dependent GTPase A [Clostridia bacterium]